MSKYIIVVLLLTLSSCGNKPSLATVAEKAEQKSCDCPENEWAGTKVDTIFTFSSGTSIALCGYRNEGKPISWSEFVMAECGQDTLLSAWNATINAEIKIVSDTLLVEEIWNLPTGTNFEYEPTVYGINYIFKKDGRTIVGFTPNKEIRKYTPAQIDIVLKEYETLSNDLQDDTMEMANKLFIAAISGSKKAHQYFIDFDNKFMLDGAFAEEYKDLAAVLRFYVD